MFTDEQEKALQDLLLKRRQLDQAIQELHRERSSHPARQSRFEVDRQYGKSAF
jgi:hypothetical protein